MGVSGTVSGSASLPQNPGYTAPTRTAQEAPTMPQYWLFKTEPDEYSIDDLAREGECLWEGIRNYQARNRLRDEVKVGDLVFIYHSSCAVPAVVGLAEVTAAGCVEDAQFNAQAPYCGSKSTREAPRWVTVRVRYREHLPNAITLKDIKSRKSFADMELVTRARLSIQHVSQKEAAELLKQGQ